MVGKKKVNVNKSFNEINLFGVVINCPGHDRLPYESLMCLQTSALSYYSTNIHT